MILCSFLFKAGLQSTPASFAVPKSSQSDLAFTIKTKSPEIARHQMRFQTSTPIPPSATQGVHADTLLNRGQLCLGPNQDDIGKSHPISKTLIGRRLRKAIGTGTGICCVGNQGRLMNSMIEVTYSSSLTLYACMHAGMGKRCCSCSLVIDVLLSLLTNY
jgi:hypothetical protein